MPSLVARKQLTRHPLESPVAVGRRLPAVRAVGVSKSYRYGVPGCSGAVRALMRVSLYAAPGELVGVSGAPGSGKSTLLGCCAGLLRPDAGYIVWSSGATRGVLPPDEAALVLQRPAFPRWLTVREVLDRYVRRRESEQRAPAFDNGYAAVLGSSVHARTRVEDLSAAAIWCVALLVAVRSQPRLLIADGIDGDGMAGHAKPALELIRRLCDHGIAALVSARHGAVLQPLADRLLVLDQGRLITDVSRHAEQQGRETGRAPDAARVARSGARSVDRMIAVI